MTPDLPTARAALDDAIRLHTTHMRTKGPYDAASAATEMALLKRARTALGPAANADPDDREPATVRGRTMRTR